MADDQDWRLEAELDTPDRRGALDRLLGRLRGPDVVHDIESRLPHDLVVTHDGNRLFAYAAAEQDVRAARRTIEEVLTRDGVSAQIVLSHWDDELEEWKQIDPPPVGEQAREERQVQEDAEKVETRTLVASAGKLIRSSFEQSLLEWAERLGLEVEIAEHPHLLSTQVLFTVTGPKRKIDEFARALRAEGLTTLRSDATLMLNPL